MKKVAGPLRVLLAQYRELEAFTSFASDLDAGTLEQLATGRALMHSIRQMPGSPMPVANQVAVLYAGTNKWLVNIAIHRIPEAIKALNLAIENSAAGQAYASRFAKSPVLDDELKAMLEGLMHDALSTFQKARK